jgi:hypothetical protein
VHARSAEKKGQGVIDYAAQIYALDDADLERLIDDWVASMRSRYPDSDRFSGARDMGRDVVGYHSRQRFDGPWDNFQCKQLRKALGEPEMLRELGKVFFHAVAGHFPVPRSYVFVAPKGAVRAVRTLISQPSKIAPRLVERWDDCCATHLVQGEFHPLSDAVRAAIDGFAFENVSLLEAGKLVRDDAMKPVLVKWFSADPGEAPVGEVPAGLQPEERGYIDQLLAAYRERGAVALGSGDDALAHAEYGEHFRVQRERFFDAAAFKRYYRDSTEPRVLEAFDNDIFHGVFDTHQLTHADALAKIAAVMVEAKGVTVAGVLGRYARVPVKQGTCHHFANSGRLVWVK